MDLKVFKVKLRLTEQLLGTVPKNREVYSTYIASKAREAAEKACKVAARNGEVGRMAGGGEATSLAVAELVDEEVETVGDVEERGWTGFHSDDAGPFLYDYALKGYLKEAARTLKDSGKGDKSVKQLQDKVNRYVFVFPRRIRLPGIELLPCERPLRALTAQGPRVALARSDVVAAGAVLEFEMHLLAKSGLTRGILEEILSYGKYQGLGQWRSGGNGRFEVAEFSAD